MGDLPAAVLDAGSGWTKVGYAGEEIPRAVFPTSIDYVNADNQKVSMRFPPVEHGFITNFEDMEKVWNYSFYDVLKTNPKERKVLLTESVQGPRANRENITQIMFEKYQVPALYLGMQATLALFASGRVTGVTLDSGDGITYAVPIYEGCPLPHAIERLPTGGGKHLTDSLMTLLSLRHREVDRATAQKIKEELGFIAPRHLEASPLELQDFRTPDGKVIQVGMERFVCPGSMFLDQGYGIGSMQHVVYESIYKCDLDIRSDMFANIVLSGGNTMFRGFAERLTEELKALQHTRNSSSSIILNIEESPRRDIYPWLGGSILAALDSFQPAWFTKAAYEESGPSVMHRKYF